MSSLVCAYCRGVIRTAFLRAKLPWLFVPSELLYICWHSHFLLAGRMDSREMHTTYDAIKKEKRPDIWLHSMCSFRAEEAVCCRCCSPVSSFGLLMSAVQLAAAAQSPGARLSKKIIFLLCFLSSNWFNSSQLRVSSPPPQKKKKRKTHFDLLNWPGRTEIRGVVRPNSCDGLYKCVWFCVTCVKSRVVCVLCALADEKGCPGGGRWRATGRLARLRGDKERCCSHRSVS